MLAACIVHPLETPMGREPFLVVVEVPERVVGRPYRRRAATQKVHRHGNHFCDTPFRRQSIWAWAGCVFAPRGWYRHPRKLEKTSEVSSRWSEPFVLADWFRDGLLIATDTEYRIVIRCIIVDRLTDDLTRLYHVHNRINNYIIYSHDNDTSNKTHIVLRLKMVNMISRNRSPFT